MPSANRQANRHQTSLGIPPAEWRLIKRAADAIGASMTGFITAAAVARARLLIEAMETEAATPIASRVPILQGKLPPHLAELAPPLSAIAVAAVPRDIAAELRAARAAGTTAAPTDNASPSLDAATTEGDPNE